MKKIVFVLLGLALVAGVVTVCFLTGDKSESVRDSRPAVTAKKAIADVGRKGIRKGASGKRQKAEKPVLSLSDDDDEESSRTPEEKKLAADIEKALDEENFELAKKCAPLAMTCKDTEIRQAMVDTLGWFGEKAIPELTPFIADPDEDVAESAMNEWDCAVSSVEDEELKIGMVEMAMQVISNEDALESISNEYIGADEKRAVESLLRIIEGGGSAKGIAKAKETYEFVTGDEFTDRAAAEKWIAEEYQPSESAQQ